MAVSGYFGILSNGGVFDFELKQQNVVAETGIELFHPQNITGDGGISVPGRVTARGDGTPEKGG